MARGDGEFDLGLFPGGQIHLLAPHPLTVDIEIQRDTGEALRRTVGQGDLHGELVARTGHPAGQTHRVDVDIAPLPRLRGVDVDRSVRPPLLFVLHGRPVVRGQIGEQEDLRVQPLFPGQILGRGLEGRFEAGGLLAGQQLSHPLFETRFVTGLLVGGCRPAGKGDEDHLVAGIEEVQQGQGLLLQLIEEAPGGKAESGAVGLVE